MRRSFTPSFLLALAALPIVALSPAFAQEFSAPLGALIPPNPPVTPPLETTPNPNEPEVTLEELIRRAQESSARLQIARENLEAALGRAQSTRALTGPTLQLVPGFSGNSTARDEQIIFAQPLDVFGLRRARAKVSDADVRRAEADVRLAGRFLEVEVKNAAALLFAAQESERLEQVQVEIAQAFRDAAAKRAALGDVPGVQVQRADLELLRFQNTLATARGERLSRRTALNALIGAAPEAPLRVALQFDASATALLRVRPDAGFASGRTSSGSAPFAPPVPATSATVGGELVTPDASLRSRPDLAGAQATLEARQAEVQALRRERLPQFELQARSAPFWGRDGSSTAVRAVITIPLFDYGALKGARRAAQAEANAQAVRVKWLNQQAAAQVESARVLQQSRRETVERYQNQLLPLTLDLLRKTQLGYTQGASTYLEVLDAQRALRQIQTEYLQALVGVQTAETAFDAALNGGQSNVETNAILSIPQSEAR